MGSWHFDTDGNVVITSYKKAETFWQRFRGLMFIKTPPEHILVIPKCRAIHGCFMRYPIDIAYFDENTGEVLRVSTLEPWYSSTLTSLPKHTGILEAKKGTFTTEMEGKKIIFQ